MKNNKYLGIIALLLVVAMALSACSGQAGGGVDEDNPVTAEGIFRNFITLKDVIDNPLGKVSLLSNTYGELLEVEDGVAIFYKEAKDKLNNLTETYSLYSVSEGKSLLNITNSYPDEYGWENDFGHETYPERLIEDVWFERYDNITYIVVEWEIRTPIDEKVIEDEDLAESYVVNTYYDFYDVTGAFIATTTLGDWGNRVYSYRGDYTLLTFGRTVAVFDDDGKLVKTYNGDVEATPKSYIHSNDKYDYLVVPNGIVDESVEENRIVLEIYDKEGNLVRSYANGDYATYIIPYVLESGDVLIQHCVCTQNADCDIDMGGMYFNIDTFLLDVESGKVTELTDFNYVIESGDVIYADDFEEEVGIDGITATDNVRNVAYATSLETNKSCMIFFDNFGTVNFEFDYVINREMDAYDEVIKVLDANHMLVEISSGVTDRAILDESGNLVAHVPDYAILLADYIVCDGVVYDFDMKRVCKIDTYWASQYESISDPYAFGNCLAFNVIDVSGTEDEPIVTESVVIVYASSGSTRTYQNARISDGSDDGDMGDYLVVEREIDSSRVCVILNGNGIAIFTSPNGYNVYVTETDGAIFVEVDNKVYLITEVEADVEGGDDK